MRKEGGAEGGALGAGHCDGHRRKVSSVDSLGLAGDRGYSTRGVGVWRACVLGA